MQLKPLTTSDKEAFTEWVEMYTQDDITIEYFQTGDLFVERDELLRMIGGDKLKDVYMLVKPGADSLVLISLADGNRWHDAIDDVSHTSHRHQVRGVLRDNVMIPVKRLKETRWILS